MQSVLEGQTIPERQEHTEGSYLFTLAPSLQALPNSQPRVQGLSRKQSHRAERLELGLPKYLGFEGQNPREMETTRK